MMSLSRLLLLRRRRLLFSLLFFQNLSIIIALTHSNHYHNSNNNHTHLLRDILKEISTKQKWDLEQVRDLKLRIEKVRFGAAQREDFRVKLGKKTQLRLKLPEEVTSWRKKLIASKADDRDADFWSVVREVGSMGVLDSFKMEGPFELRIGLDDADDRFSLSMPPNSSHTGLRRICVAEGITVEVTGAQEVSLFYLSDLGSQENRSDIVHEKKLLISPYWHSFCLPLFPIRILGSASIIAYRTRNPGASIKTTFLSEDKDVINLLPDKCYSSHFSKKQAFPIVSLNSRIAMLARVLKDLIGDRIREDGLLVSLKANIRASAIIRFQLELERNIGSNDTLQGTLAEWRTRPVVERVWYDVTSRVEEERLKPLLIKKVRPFIGVDSAAWSSLMSNISFTKFPPILVPPEALTLDVKW